MNYRMISKKYIVPLRPDINIRFIMTKIDKSILTFGVTIFLKFILFDILWCIPTTFASLSTVECYTTKLIATFILLIPYAFFRMWKTETFIMLLLDFLLIANLMYFRTYYTAIPLNSYGLSGNLADFTGSVIDSLRWYDSLFPLSTLIAAETPGSGSSLCRNTCSYYLYFWNSNPYERRILKGLREVS